MVGSLNEAIVWYEPQTRGLENGTKQYKTQIPAQGRNDNAPRILRSPLSFWRMPESSETIEDRFRLINLLSDVYRKKSILFAIFIMRKEQTMLLNLRDSICWKILE